MMDLTIIVVTAGFEPATPSVSAMYSNQLNYVTNLVSNMSKNLSGTNIKQKTRTYSVRVLDIIVFLFYVTPLPRTDSNAQHS